MKKLLDSYNLQPLVEAAKKDRGIIRMLISLVYDKEDVRSWRAIEAIGIAAGEIAKTNVDAVRNLSQRFLWMLREESGNGPGSAPEMLGEIVRNSPDVFADIGQVLTSFHDEMMLRRGVMRALWRISEKRPDLLCMTCELMEKNLYLNDEDALVRAYALMTAGALDRKDFLPVIEDLKSDTSPVRFYDGGEFNQTTVGEVANKVYAGFAGRES
ncbi:MAG TPA: hypothetical protein VEP69_00310 [Thermodesulfovibrionales bacterium]|nr:hypothetical protein [Thermodesulfovibrionales bacterium]